MRRSRAALGLALALAGGCGRPAERASDARAGEPPPPRFEDVTARAGLRWTHNPCRTGKKYLPETVGGGGGFIDYDRDGRLDILLVNGAPLPGYKGPVPRHALYRNDGDGTFSEVTDAAGLTTKEYGIEAAVGDYDNDGWPDIFLTAVGTTRLLRNDHGRFVDVTQKAKAGVSGFTTAAAWIDYDRDGRLDLYVGRYVAWTPQTDLPCGPAEARQYCPPHQYPAAPAALLHQRPDGVFEEVSGRMGIPPQAGKTLAAVPYDVNDDGWVDLFVADDTEPDLLLINEAGKRFVDRALESGVAVGSDGSPTGSMGVDIGTLFGDSRIGIAVGVFAGQQLSLFVSDPAARPNLLFDNRKQESGVAEPTHAMTTFGLVFLDANLDSRPDIAVLNGHIDDDQALSAGGKRVTYRQPAQLFVGRGEGSFVDRAEAAGIAAPQVGRGLAVGDYDNDGRPDLLAFENGGPVRLWHNATPAGGGWLGLELVGRAPRDASGAMVTLHGRGWSQTRCVTTARSYLSVCDPRLLTGLPPGGIEKVEIRWPDGASSRVDAPASGRYLRIVEPGGVQ